MTGCPIARACLLACWLGELSQQSVTPHSWHVRKWTQVALILTHSSHSRRFGCLIELTASMCEQLSSELIISLRIAVSVIATLLGGNGRAFFRDGTFHHENQDGERGREHAEDEKAIEISERG